MACDDDGKDLDEAQTHEHADDDVEVVLDPVLEALQTPDVVDIGGIFLRAARGNCRVGDAARHGDGRRRVEVALGLPLRVVADSAAVKRLLHRHCRLVPVRVGAVVPCALRVDCVPLVCDERVNLLMLKKN